MSERVVIGALLKRGSKEEKEFDRKFWRDQGAEARFHAVWQMAAEAFWLKGITPIEPRLQRNVHGIERRRG